MSRLVAGVVGNPVRHSLSPLIHGAWIDAAGLDAAYNRFEVERGGFAGFIGEMRGGRVRGLNVTIPFKEDALALADETDAAAEAAGAANLLLFGENGVLACNTDGIGLMAAFAEQAPGFDPTTGPVVVLGAGGAARGAVPALLGAGAGEVRILNRTRSKADLLANRFGAKVSAYDLGRAEAAFDGAVAVINATAAGLDGAESLHLPLGALPATAVVMDMVYKPLLTPLLAAATARGLATVDGLSMLIGQARPSFEAFYGRAPPADTDVRRLCLEALGEAS